MNIRNAGQLIVVLIQLAAVQSLFAQDSVSKDEPLSATQLDWEKAKDEYFKAIEASNNEIVLQIDKREEKARSDGDIKELQELKRIRQSFQDLLEIDASLKRDKYDKLRSDAKVQLTAVKEKSLTSLLSLNFDSAADVIQNEWTELSDSLNSDVLSMWNSALNDFRLEMDGAMALMRSQFEALESKARDEGDLQQLDRVKNSRSEFLATGKLPDGIDARSFQARVRAAKNKIERRKTEITRHLLRAKRDDKAKQIEVAYLNATSGKKLSQDAENPTGTMESEVNRQLSIGSLWLQEGGAARLYQLTEKGLVIVSGRGSDRSLNARILLVEFDSGTIQETLNGSTAYGKITWSKNRIVITWDSGAVVPLNLVDNQDKK